MLKYLLAACCAFSALGNPKATPDVKRLAASAIHFEPATESGQFVSRGPAYSLRARAGSVLFTAGDRSVAMTMPGANADARPEALDPTPARSNYLLGADRTKWRTGVERYGRVSYRGIYPGIDLVFHGANEALEYDFVVRPGADPSVIHVRFGGQDKLRLDADGGVTLSAGASEFRNHRPVVYQTVDGKRREIASAFRRIDADTLAFDVAEWDRSRELVIDPVISWATYLGGRSTEGSISIAVDPAGNVYMTGATQSTDFPVTAGVFSRENKGRTDIFVTKFNTNGAVQWSTYLGGRLTDVPSGIAVDANGNAVIVGTTDATDYPLEKPFQSQNKGGSLGLDYVITKLNANGAALVFSTYLGGTLNELADAVTVDSTGAIYVAGSSFSDDFPVTNGAFQRANNGLYNATVSKFDASGTALIYSTYLGGTGNTFASGIRVNAANEVFLGGDTGAGNFPATSNAFQRTLKGLSDGFVAKFNATGSALIYATLVGGLDVESASDVAIDAEGNAYLVGRTASTDFPVTSNPAQRTLGGGPQDAYVAKVSPNGSALVYATYLGGNRPEFAGGIVVDSAGRAVITGSTAAPNFPVVDPIVRDPNAQDAFVTVLKADGAIEFSTFLGGGQDEIGSSVGIDARGNVYVSGSSGSIDIGTTQGAAQPVLAGGADAFLLKLDFAPPNNTLTVNPAQVRFTGAARTEIPRTAVSIVAAAGARPNWTLEVTTAQGGNWLDATPRAGTGSATVNVSANAANLADGTYNGTITLVNTTLNTRTAIPVTLTLTPAGAAVSSNGILHTATQKASTVVPGLLLTVFGRDLGPTDIVRAEPVDGALPTTLGGVRVLFDDTPAALSYVSATQIGVFVPYAIAGKLETRLSVEFRGQRSASVTLPAGKTAPGIFTANSTGSGQATAKNGDGSDNSEANPVARDSTITVIATGDGVTDPPGVDGRIATDDSIKPAAQVQMFVGGEFAEIVSYGSVPGLPAGYFSVTAKIPPTSPGGSVPVLISVGGEASQDAVTVAVAPPKE